MNDLFFHLVRMQDAGVKNLHVTLGAYPDGTRGMWVGVDVFTEKELSRKFPVRYFTLEGVDRTLQGLQDEMAFSEGGPTPEKLEAAIKRYRIAEKDLREWYDDWVTCSIPTDEELDSIYVSEEEVTRGVQRVKDVMKGMNIAKAFELNKTKESTDAHVHSEHPEWSILEYGVGDDCTLETSHSEKELQAKLINLASESPAEWSGPMDEQMMVILVGPEGYHEGPYKIYDLRHTIGIIPSWWPNTHCELCDENIHIPHVHFGDEDKLRVKKEIKNDY